jgi:spermidine synthase
MVGMNLRQTDHDHVHVNGKILVDVSGFWKIKLVLALFLGYFVAFPVTGMPNSQTSRLYTFSFTVILCFFFSGLAGLIYQILWLRMIDKVIGSAPFAVATVLSVFMGGLALGSWIAGKYVDRISSKGNLLALYGKVEFAIGVYGILLPVFIHLIKFIYVPAYNSLFMYPWLYRIFTFFGCSLLLIVPTTLMGVTLPLLCRYYVEDLGHIGARTGRLYGVNTIGSATGAALCGFVLLSKFGVWGSLLIAVAINLVIGALCVRLARVYKPRGPEFFDKHKIDAKRKGQKLEEEPKISEMVVLDNRIIFKLALWVFGVSGFCSMAYEVIWTRLLGLLIGPTTYSFSLVVSTFIIGLALGNIIFGWLADKVKSAFRLLVTTQACAAFLALIVSQFLGNSQFFFSKLIYTFQNAFGERMLAQSIILFLVLVGPTILLGATFPLVNKIYARSLPEVGKSIGTAYAANTVGSILGSFVAGFIFIPLLGKENGLRIAAGLQIFFSISSLSYHSFKIDKRARGFVTSSVTLMLGFILLISFPSWNHNILYRGFYHRFEILEQYFSTTSWLNSLRKGPLEKVQSVANNEVVFYGDGIGGITAVEKLVSPIGTANYFMIISGKTDATSHGDRLTQGLLTHIPLLFHPNPEKVMVLGLASGMTAGEALLYPIRQLDILEINDQVIKASKFFTPWNNGCLTNPKSRIIVQDGRNHLELTNEKYDVIISEPSNPWMAGLADLFTLDYFKTVKERLNGNGIFVQWTHAYDMDWDCFAMIGRTFAEVFPESLLVRTISTSDYLLIGFSEKKILDLKTADKNLVYAAKSKNITIRDPRVIFNLIVTEDLKSLFGSGPFHTDNWPHLEFAAPKNIDRNDLSIDEKIENSSRLSGETKNIVDNNKNIDSLLDNLELLKDGPAPPFKEINLKDASLAQINRYQNILEEYCTENCVTDFEIFPTAEYRKKCAGMQVRMIQDHLASNSKDSGAFYRLALGLGIMGDTGAEMEAMQKAIALNPSYFEAYMELGAVYGSLGRFQEAIAQFSNALRINPDSAEAHNNIGNALLNQGENEKAIEHFSRTLQIHPEWAQIYSNRGAAFANLGKTNKAAENFSKAIELEPGNAAAHDNLGRLLAAEGRREEALNQIYEALKIAPESADFHNDAGLVLGQQGKIRDSIAHFSEALKTDPNHPLVIYNMGIALSGLGKNAEAISYFLKAAELNPDDADVHERLGIGLQRIGRLKEAVTHFSEALRLQPNSAEYEDNLGDALAEAGRLEEAKDHFGKALEIDKSYAAARNHLNSTEKRLEKRSPQSDRSGIHY